MYVIYLSAIDPASEEGKPQPGTLPNDDGAGAALSKAADALAKLPGSVGAEGEAIGANAYTYHGEAALPHADAVRTIAHQLYRELVEGRKQLRLELSGYVVDQSGVTPLTTPAT